MADLVFKDHYSSAYERLLYQFQDKENLNGFLKSLLYTLNDTQTSTLDLLNIFDLDNAYGFTLDLIGQIVVESRKGRTDESYKKAIKTKIFINTSEGTPNQTINIAQLISESEFVTLFEHRVFSPTYLITNGIVDSSTPKTLKQVSPITTTTVVVYDDNSDNALIPSELEIAGGYLIDEQGREFVTDQDLKIAVNYLSSQLTSNSEKGVLPEDGDLVFRELCEAYHS